MKRLVKMMITNQTLVEITIAVPIGSIEIIDRKVNYEPEDRHHPEYWDIDYDIEVEGLKYDIIDYQDDIIDDKIIQDWRNET